MPNIGPMEWLLVGVGVLLLLLVIVWKTREGETTRRLTWAAASASPVSGSSAGPITGWPRAGLAPDGDVAVTPALGRASGGEGTWSSPGYRSARLRARWAQLLVGIAAAIYAVGAVTGVNELSLLDRMISGSATDSEVTSFVRFTDSLNSLSILAMVVSAIAVLAWLSRAVEIVPPLGGGTPHRSPREAIGWWFVPIASFFIPYQIVRDVYGRLATPTRPGREWSVLAWWLLFLIGGLVTRATGIAINGATTIDTARSIEMISVAALVATSLGGFLFVTVVGEIESRATERAVSLSLRGPDAVWPGSMARSGPTLFTPTIPASTSTVVDEQRTDSSGASVVAEARALPTVAENPGSNIETRLTTLERLRSTGTITEEEYAARRSKILDDL